MLFHKVNSISGRLMVPGDKSISHRAVMLGALASGKTEITHFLQGADCLSTIHCFRKMGIHIENDKKNESVLVHGKGLYGLTMPSEVLDVGNSGTTMRMLSGILSGQPFKSCLTGDSSIKKRPMDRIIKPLTLMGADIIGSTADNCAPLTINGTNIRQNDKAGYEPRLHPIHYSSPVASAQIKSSVLFAGLYSDGITSVTEPYLSRNHTEIMLKQFGVGISIEDTTVSIKPYPALSGIQIEVPGDISSAAYFIAAAAILPNSEIVISNVGVNPTRDGILRVCKKMGVTYFLENIRNEDAEAVCDIRVCSSNLTGCTIEKDLIPTLIDEIPIIAVMACFAEGTTIIKDAAELKVKESNRISIMTEYLSAMGADITATEDGMIIVGKRPLHAAEIDSKDDHRIAMSFAICALLAEGETKIKGAECVEISYPAFYEDLNRLIK